jgi:hypothetical protein
MKRVDWHLVNNKGVRTLWAFEIGDDGKVNPWIYQSNIKVDVSRDDIVACHDSEFFEPGNIPCGSIKID